MLKPFLKDSALYGSANMLARAIQIFLVPLYTRILRPEDYGVIDMMMVIGTIGASILTLEVTSGMARSYADATDPAERAGYTTSALAFVAAAAALVVAVAMLAPGLGRLAIGDRPALVFRVAALSIGVQMLYGTLSVHLRFERRPIPFVIGSIILTIVQSGLTVYLVVVARIGVLGVFYGQLASYVVAGAFLAASSRRGLRGPPEARKLREMLAYSAPLMISIIGTQILLLGDRVLINVRLGLDDVGVYGIGARVAGTVGLVVAGFSAALGPLVFQHYRDPETPAHLARLFRILLLLLLPIGAAFSLFAPEIVWVLTTPAYERAATVIPLLTFSTILTGCTVFAPGLELARRTSVLAGITVAVAAENVILNLLLIPRLGVRGSALATLISAATGFAVTLYASQRLYRAPHRYLRLGVAVAVVAVAWGAGAAISRASLGWVATLGLKGAVLAVALAGFAAALLDRRDLRILKDRLSPPPPRP